MDTTGESGESSVLDNVQSCDGCIRPLEESFLENVPELNQHLVRCIVCHKCRGILVDDERKFVTLSQALDAGREVNGWVEVKTLPERRTLYILSQILHNEQDLIEADGIEFRLPPLTDHVKILWIHGQAIGFYSVKPKGTFDLETMSTYSMFTVDTIFIRKSHRRRGFGLTALQTLRADFPSEKIGFSYPLTPSMRQVLWKHLKETGEDRIRFWECTDGWDGGSRNVWLSLQRENKASCVNQSQNNNNNLQNINN